MTLWCCRSYSCGLFRIYCFVPLKFTLSGTICSSVELKSSGMSWDSFHKTKQDKAWSSIYFSHNATEQQCLETCFCSCLQQMHIDFLLYKLLTSPRVVVLKKRVGTPFPRVPISLHPWFRFKPNSSTKYRSDAPHAKRIFSSRNPLSQSVTCSATTCKLQD